MKLFMLTILFLSGLAIADHHKGHGKNFEKMKSRALNNMDKRIAQLQKSRSCVEASKDRDALMKCREEMKSFRKTMKAERIKRKEMKSEKK